MVTENGEYTYEPTAGEVADWQHGAKVIHESGLDMFCIDNDSMAYFQMTCPIIVFGIRTDRAGIGDMLDE